MAKRIYRDKTTGRKVVFDWDDSVGEPTEDDILSILDKQKVPSNPYGKATGIKAASSSNTIADLGSSIFDFLSPNSLERGADRNLSSNLSDIFLEPIPEVVNKADDLAEDIQPFNSDYGAGSNLTDIIDGFLSGFSGGTVSPSRERNAAVKGFISEATRGLSKVPSLGDVATLGTGSLARSSAKTLPRTGSALYEAARALDSASGVGAASAGAGQVLSGIEGGNFQEIASGLLGGTLGLNTFRGYQPGGEKIPAPYSERLPDDLIKNKTVQDILNEAEILAEEVKPVGPRMEYQETPIDIGSGLEVPQRTVDDKLYDELFFDEAPSQRGFNVEDIDLELPSDIGLAEGLRRKFFSDTPSGERGAVGDSGKLNSFEDSQAKKYGPEWRVKQSDAEKAFHEKLLRGEGNFSKVESGTQSEAAKKAVLKEFPQIDVDAVLKDFDPEAKIDIDDVSSTPKKLVSDSGEVNPDVLSEMVRKAKEKSGIGPARRETDIDTLVSAVRNEIRGDSGKVPKPKGPEVQGRIRIPSEDVAVDMTDDIHIDLDDDAVAADVTDKVKQYVRVPKDLQPPKASSDTLSSRQVSDQSDPLLPKSSKDLNEKSLAEDIFDLPKTIRSSFDISAPGRQGLFLLNRPEALKSIFRGGKSLREKYHLDVQKDLAERPNAALYKESGLSQVEYEPGGDYSKTDEFFPSQLASKIPGMKQSERVFIDQGNLMRADMFDKFATEFQKQGKTFENRPDLYRGLASYLNTLTGRTALPESLKGASKILNKTFWSPRFLASRIQLLNPAFYYKLPREIQKEALRDVGGTVAVGAGLLYATAEMLKAAGHEDVEVQTDPRHTNFGKLTVGKTSYDFSAGLVPLIRTIARIGTGVVKTPSGEYKYKGRREDLDLKDAPFGRDEVDEGLKFTGNKLSPGLTAPYYYAKGTGFAGEKYGAGELARDLVEPMSISEFRQALYDYDTGSYSDINEALKTIPGFFGVGVQTEMHESEKASDSSGSSKKKSKKKRIRF